MASGSFNLTRTGSTSSYVSFVCNWSSISNGSSENSSTVYVDVIATKSSSSNSNTWGTHSTSASVEGENKSDGGSFTLRPGSSITLLSKSYVVKHDDDGTKSTTISVSIGGDVMWGNGSANITLDTIPRASEIDSFTCNTNYIDGKYTIAFTPKKTSFYYKLRLSIPNVIQICNVPTGKDLYGSQFIKDYKFTQEEIDLIIKNSYTNTDKITIGAVIETYTNSSYSEKIGESEEETLNLLLPANIVPSIDNVTIREYDDKITDKFGDYVQNKSQLVIDISASGIYSSTISAYKTKINGVEYEGSSIITDVLKEKGKNDIEIIVIDSRGRTSTTKKEVTAIEYQEPKANIFTVERAARNGSIVELIIDAFIYDIEQKNDKKFTLKYKKQKEEEYKIIELDNTNFSFIIRIRKYFRR